jgi:hypothetical protein
MPYDDEYDDDEREDSVDEDLADLGACPACRKPIYEDTERCPHCGEFISSADTSDRKPMWVIIAAIVCLAAIMWYWVL